MPRAIWNGTTIAESDETVEVEGNQYFPPESVEQDILHPSDTHTTCPWKGEASYYSLETGGETADDAAWFYPDPKPAAQNIKDHVAFGGGVTVEA